MNDEKLKRLGEYGIVPVVVLEDAKDAKPLGQALCDGGLACAEVTFRTAAAQEAIRIMKDSFPDMLVGAGTVLTVEQVDQAVEAGAEFIVSPGLNPKVVTYCLEHDILIIPGVVTPGEIEKAMDLGLRYLKFFPAEPSGGINMLKALAGPYQSVQFMPTGGISLENIEAYLTCSNILACGGSWMVKDAYIKAGDFDTVRRLVAEAAELVKKVRG